MKKLFPFLVMIAVFSYISYCFADELSTFKLAIFDNPYAELPNSNSSSELIQEYFQGINTAKYVATTKDINIDVKVFFHSSNVIEIMHKAADVNSWNPSLIIGFHTSNDFIMAKSFFSDKLLLSITATDKKISTLPNNFYSLGIPDMNLYEPIINTVNLLLPKPNLFIAVAAESKESIGLSKLIANSYHKKYPERNVIIRQYLTEDINIMHFNKFMRGYKQGDIVILIPRGYLSSFDMMNKIANYLSPIKPTFLIAADNWGGSNIPKTIQDNYSAYRIDTLSGLQNTSEYKTFAEGYQKIYHTPPTDTISYVTYRAVMSFVTALKRYPPPPGLTTTQAVLWSYQQALKHDPNWFRPTQYTVYKLVGNKEIYYETLQQPVQTTDHAK